ncbi:MAG: hypothetical protein L0K74_04395 [Acidipropionibacterium acidipropionici]|nr:hypothetical protein [Acidipropionibacterium acidipropionici]
MAAGLALVMVSGVAGCARDDAVAGGSPSGSGGSATASGSGVSRPRGSGVSTPAPSEDPLFTEAKAVHLKYVEEFVALEKAGGADSLPVSMRTLVSGEYEVATNNLFKEIRQRGVVASSDSKWKIVTVRRLPSSEGFAIDIRSCVDFRDMHYSLRDGTSKSSGTLRIDTLKMKRERSSLVISDGSSRRVKKCDV